MSKIIRFNGETYTENRAELLPIDTTQYTDYTDYILTTYNLRNGFYHPSQNYFCDLENPHGQTTTLINRFMAFDLVPKTSGEYIVVIPDNISVYRRIANPTSSWNHTDGYIDNPSITFSKPIHLYSDYIMKLKNGCEYWAFQCGIASGTLTKQYLIDNGYKIYKKTTTPPPVINSGSGNTEQ